MSPEVNLPSQLPLFNFQADATISPPIEPTASTENVNLSRDILYELIDASPRNEEQQNLYQELMQLSEEWASTLWIDPLYQDAYETVIAATTAAAARAGLAESDILEALRLGKERGQTLRQQTVADRDQPSDVR